MAVIKPFRGIRFNPEKVENLQAVVSQPYDKIDDALQASYYQLSPYNIVRIIQGKVEEGDQPLTPNGPNVYTRARSYLKNWMSQSILKRDETPSFYAYEQTFTVAGERYTRLGLIAAVELVEYDKGIILPHERTHSGPKEDRLRLLSTLQTNTEQIFILYPDEENVINKLIRQATQHREPDLDVVEIKESDVVQRVWQITDPQIVNAIRAEMAPKRGLIIADGHHRYATGLTYSASQRQAHPDAPAAAAFNYVAATLVSMEDPGLVILPTHREIFNFTGSSPRQILERAREHFDVQRASNLAATLSALEEDASGPDLWILRGPRSRLLDTRSQRQRERQRPDRERSLPMNGKRYQ